ALPIWVDRLATRLPGRLRNIFAPEAGLILKKQGVNCLTAGKGGLSACADVSTRLDLPLGQHGASFKHELREEAISSAGRRGIASSRSAAHEDPTSQNRRALCKRHRARYVGQAVRRPAPDRVGSPLVNFSLCKRSSSL